MSTTTEAFGTQTPAISHLIDGLAWFIAAFGAAQRVSAALEQTPRSPDEIHAIYQREFARL